MRLRITGDWRLYQPSELTTLAERIEKRLDQARASNIARFGIHRQAAAIMTCIVPSISESNHVHFVDGAAGGYALAAKQFKLEA